MEILWELSVILKMNKGRHYSKMVPKLGKTCVLCSERETQTI